MVLPVTKKIWKEASRRRRDPAFFLDALARPGSERLVQYASRELRSDEEFLAACVRANPRCVDHLPFECRRDAGLMRELAAVDGWRALCLAEPPARTDPALLAAAVAQDGSALQLVAEEDMTRELYMAAARNYRGVPLLLSHTSHRRRSRADRELFLSAAAVPVSECCRASVLSYADASLRDDPAVVTACVGTRAEDVAFASTRLLADGRLLRSLVLANPHVAVSLPVELRSDALLELALEKDGSVYMRGPASWRDRADVLRTAMATFSTAYCYASEAVRSDLFLAIDAVRRDPVLLRYVPAPVRSLPVVAAWAPERQLVSDVQRHVSRLEKQRATLERLVLSSVATAADKTNATAALGIICDALAGLSARTRSSALQMRAERVAARILRPKGPYFERKLRRAFEMDF